LTKKQSALENSAKNKPKKQANFNQNKPKNKQPASIQKKRKSTKNKPKFAGKPQGWQHCVARKLRKRYSSISQIR